MIITNEQINSSTQKISVSGKLNVVGAADFRRKLEKIPTGTTLIFDFGDVNYISSAGLREILICRKKFPNLRIENVRNDVYQIFLMTGFDKFIPLTSANNSPQQNFGDNTDESLSFKKFLRDKVAESADEIVIVRAGEKYSWRDIDRCSDVIAADLSQKNVRRGTHVAICGANSINWLLTFFAIQKLGAIAVLVNFNLCAKEISALVNYTDVTCICYGEMSAPVDEVKNFCDVYSIRDEDFKARQAVNEKFPLIVREDDPAVMIFTSGTTGKLKGVLLSSYNILNAAQINSRDQTLRADDKACVILPFFHIFGLIAGIFANMIAGVTIYMPEKTRTNSILELISRERCTIFHSVPTMLLALINNKTFSADKVSSLRCSIISGTRATESQIKILQRHMPNNHFMSSYGLSEMAPVSITVYGDDLQKILHTVGKPVKNIRVKILNPDSSGVGEILVQGFNLMAGYYKLSPDEQPIDANGWLHTGDLGSVDAGGYLRLTGRIKEIIIRGGENVYPAEVEAVISEADFVDDVKVIGVPDDFFGEVVCACLKLKTSKFDENKFRDWLATRLAKFKIPAHFLIYEKFPLLGSGKVDLLALKRDAEKILSR
ncbi:MAG: AMP-binding protein [Selenomonadaceae bacterium]|nr:AMP-binding protein [Selenomonadaceae bacterium]